MSESVHVCFAPPPAGLAPDDVHRPNAIYIFPSGSDSAGHVDDLRMLEETFGLLMTVVKRQYPYGHGAGAEDILSTLFLGFFKARRAFDSARGVRFSTYAFSVVRNSLADLGRFEQDSSALTEIEPSLENSGEMSVYDEFGFEEAETTDLRDHVRSFVRGLPPRQRQVAVLIYWDGLTPAEAARRLGISRAAVNDLLAKIRAKGQEVLAAFNPSAETGRLAA